MSESQAIDGLAVGLDNLDEALAHSMETRRQAIAEAVSWPSGSSQCPRVTVYQQLGEGSSIRFGKPGKEAGREKNPNKNDMTPQLWVGRHNTAHRLSFAELYGWLEDLARDERGVAALSLLAVLAIRNTFMLDHRAEGAGWRYFPEETALSELEVLAPTIGLLPAKRFLHYLDAIALNEDVKYNAEAIEPRRGRPNNLLTTVRVISVLLGRERLSPLLAPLVRSGRGGVSPIEPREALRRFPMASRTECRSSAELLEFERYVHEVLGQHRGHTAEQIAEETDTPLRGTGWRHAAVRNLLLAHPSCPQHVRSLLVEKTVALRVVRLDHNLKPKENIRLGPLRFRQIGCETWDTSELASIARKRHMYVVFAEDKYASERLARIRWHSFGSQDMASIRKVWRIAQTAVLRNRLDRLPKASNRNTRVCLVNTHGSHKDTSIGPDGLPTTSRSFYLSPEYAAGLLDRP